MRPRTRRCTCRVGITLARAKYGAALAIARACPGDMAIEIREMAGYA